MTERLRRLPWIPLLLLGAALLVLSRNTDEAERVAHLLPKLSPPWLAAAVVLQVATYVCVGAVYRVLARGLRAPLTLAQGTRMAVVNLFVNSAVPSAGFSGNLFLVSMLDRIGIPPARGALVVLSERVVYFAALLSFVLAFAARQVARAGGALAIPLLVLLALLFALGLRTLLARPVACATRIGAVVRRLPRFLRARMLAPERLVEDARRIEEAGGVSAIAPWRFGVAFIAQWGLLVCDALTIWALLAALGVAASPMQPAVAYGLSTLIAQSVMLPGALEVTLGGVLVAQRIRATVAIAVAAIFHVLSLWVVMPFGAWFYGRAGIERR